MPASVSSQRRMDKLACDRVCSYQGVGYYFLGLERAKEFELDTSGMQDQAKRSPTSRNLR